MNTKTICPPKRPGRCTGCGANCETFKKHRAESIERYKRNAMDVQIKDVMYRGRKRR